MFDITALGELLVDFTPFGKSAAGNDIFERNPGGAPANLLTAASRMGRKTAFLGMVGKDKFGFFLRDVLLENRIGIEGLRFSENVGTTLAFVHLMDNGERSFSFYRNPGADMMYSVKDIDYRIIENSKVFHFGSISLTHETSRNVTIRAVEHAAQKGLIVSYDPNLRPALWESLEKAKENIVLGLKYADVLKVSEEEMEFITSTSSLGEGSGILFNMGIKLVLVTLGEKGCFYKYKGGYGIVEGFGVKPVDTTGAGDAFFGAVLSHLCVLGREDIDKITEGRLVEIVSFGNAAGALAVTRRGGIPAMPYRVEVEEFIKMHINIRKP